LSIYMYSSPTLLLVGVLTRGQTVTCRGSTHSARLALVGIDRGMEGSIHGRDTSGADPSRREEHSVLGTGCARICSVVIVVGELNTLTLTPMLLWQPLTLLRQRRRQHPTITLAAGLPNPMILCRPRTSSRRPARLRGSTILARQPQRNMGTWKHMQTQGDDGDLPKCTALSTTSTYRSSYDTRTMPEPPPRQAEGKFTRACFLPRYYHCLGRSSTAVSLKMQTPYGGAARHQPWDCSKTNQQEEKVN
jgi:hypothetical protein